MSETFDTNPPRLLRNSTSYNIGGKIYYGVVNGDPVNNVGDRIDIFGDRALSVDLPNPVTTGSDGRPEVSGQTVKVHVGSRYSLFELDSADVEQYQDLDRGENPSVGATISLSNVQGINTITAQASPAITEYSDKQEYVFTVAATNTDDVTLEIDNLGAKPFRFNFKEEIKPGFFQADQVVVAIFNSETDDFGWIDSGRGISLLTNVAGDGNTITADGGPSTAAYVDKQLYSFKANAANTNDVTLKVGTLSTVPIKTNGIEIQPAQFLQDVLYIVAFNSTGPVFELVSRLAFVAAENIGPGEVGSSQIAPSAVGQTEIASNAVGQSELKTATENLSSGGSSAAILLTGAGGAFTFWPRMSSSSAGSSRHVATSLSSFDANGLNFAITLGTTILTRYTLGNINAGVFTNMQNVYITASPPYDIGDGECHSFIFAMINNATGEIEAMSHAPDPTWANNGPTCIRPEYEKEGKLYRRKCVIDRSKEYQDPEKITHVEQEITKEFKNCDMTLIPHPFQGNDLTEKTIILIDPCDPIVLTAENIKNAGENAIEELFFKKYVTFGNSHLTGRATPNSSVMVVKPSWKNSR